MDSSMPSFIPFDIARETKARLMEEFKKEEVIYPFTGPANLILDVLNDLENHRGSELGTEDSITHERIPLLQIQEIKETINYPGVSISVNLILFQALDISIYVVPEVFLKFLNKVKKRFENVDPIQYKYYFLFKEHFFVLGVETPKVYMEKGKLIQDIEMASAVFKDYFFTTEILNEVMEEKMQGGF